MMALTQNLKAFVLSFVLLGLSGSVHADGIVQSATKDAVKGAVKGVQQEMNTGALPNGAKSVTKSVVDGVSDAVPQMTSQAINQANVNKKTMGKVARQVTGQAVAGAVNATVDQVNNALGEDGEGKLADTMVATTERISAALVRGIASEIHISPWPAVLGFVLGAFSTLFCAGAMLLLYLAFQRRRTPVVVENMTPVQATRHAVSTG